VLHGVLDSNFKFCDFVILLSLTWRGLNSNPGQFRFVFFFPLFCSEKRICFSRGVQVVGAAWRAVTRTVAEV
jgi:hypothetical protein